MRTPSGVLSGHSPHFPARTDERPELPLDRRAHVRYDVGLPMHYELWYCRGRSLTGTTVLREMSSVGLSFRTRSALPLGGHLKMVVDWPVRLRGLYPLQLCLTGVVLRSQRGITAVALTSRAFKADLPPADAGVVVP